MAHCSRTRAGPPALTLGRTRGTWGNRHHGPDSLDTGQRRAGTAGAASAGGNLGGPRQGLFSRHQSWPAGEQEW